MALVTPSRFAAPVDRKAVARDWAERGYSCETFTDPPGQEWNGFVHRNNELVTVVEGRLWMQVGADTCEAGPGDEVFIPRDTRHSVKNIHRGTTHWLFGYDSSAMR
jgi:quercetin dioxygenase-like cupin family protein